MIARLAVHRVRWLMTAALGSVAMLCSIAGCGGESGGSSEDAGERVRVALVLPDFSQNPAILLVKNASEATAKKLGNVELITTGSLAGDCQAQAIEDAITSQVDAILYSAIDPKAVRPALNQALAADIPIVCYLTCVDELENAARVDVDWAEVGRLEGEWLAKQLEVGERERGGEPVLVSVDGNKTQPILADLIEGRDAAIADAGVDAKIVTTPPTNFDRAKALTIASDVLTAQPRIDAMTCTADSIALSCIQALKAAGRSTIPLSSNNGDCANLQAIMNGEQGYANIVFLDSGADRALRATVRVIQGEPVDEQATVAVLGVDRAAVSAILGGNEPGPAGLNTKARLQEARGGCK